jgi:hypothetical protein
MDKLYIKLSVGLIASTVLVGYFSLMIAQACNYEYDSKRGVIIKKQNKEVVAEAQAQPLDLSRTEVGLLKERRDDMLPLHNCFYAQFKKAGNSAGTGIGEEESDVVICKQVPRNTTRSAIFVFECVKQCAHDQVYRMEHKCRRIGTLPDKSECYMSEER